MQPGRIGRWAHWLSHFFPWFPGKRLYRSPHRLLRQKTLAGRLELKTPFAPRHAIAKLTYQPLAQSNSAYRASGAPRARFYRENPYAPAHNHSAWIREHKSNKKRKCKSATRKTRVVRASDPECALNHRRNWSWRQELTSVQALPTPYLPARAILTIRCSMVATSKSSRAAPL